MKPTTLITLSIICSFCNNFTARAQTVPVQDSLALVDLYNSTNGPGWANNANWLTSAPVATWYGITAGEGVNWIQLSNNKLSGTIPMSIGNITNLTTLDLSVNQLSGNIPSTCGNLSHLFWLFLQNNQLGGSIPSSLGNLSELTQFDLSNNKLSGSIPPELGNITGLIYLFLWNNELSGAIPSSLGNMTHLQLFSLSGNQLSGGIPSSLGNLAKVTSLDLSYNQLSGSIPSSLYNLTNLTQLLLNNNQLSGSIPPLPVSLATNQPYSAYLWLQNNQFTFSGMELLPNADSLKYAPQATILLVKTGVTLSVSAGGTPANDTFRLYRNDTLVATQIADSVFIINTTGDYYITATNAAAKQLTLYSDTLNLATLPLALLNFTGTLQHAGVLLQWQATDEINTENFTVERSNTGAAFNQLGIVKANDAPGVNTYSFTDMQPQDGPNYYRLKMTDKDGAFTYSNIVTLNKMGGNFAISVYPNPSKNTAVLSFNNIADAKYSVSITDVAGKIVNQINGVARPGNNTVLVDIHGYAPGIYMLTLTVEEGRHTLTLVKE